MCHTKDFTISTIVKLKWNKRSKSSRLWFAFQNCHLIWWFYPPVPFSGNVWHTNLVKIWKNGGCWLKRSAFVLVLWFPVATPASKIQQESSPEPFSSIDWSGIMLSVKVHYISWWRNIYFMKQLQISINQDRTALGQAAAHRARGVLTKACSSSGAATLVIATGSSQFEVL